MTCRGELKGSKALVSGFCSDVCRVKDFLADAEAELELQRHLKELGEA